MGIRSSRAFSIVFRSKGFAYKPKDGFLINVKKLEPVDRGDLSLAKEGVTMKKEKTFFLFALAVFVCLGIGVTPFAGADGTQLTPYGIEFPDGTKQRTAARKWTTSVLVSPKSTPALSGTALKNALDGIIDASATKPYLLMLEPGEYELGQYDSLQMKSYVDIQGSGQGTTFITGTNMYKNYGVVKGKSNAELRFLTVRNKGGNYFSTAMSNWYESPSLLYVTIEAWGGTQNRGVYNRAYASPSMTHTKIKVIGGTSGYGVDNNERSSPIMEDVVVEVTGGTPNYGVYNNDKSSPVMNHVRILAGAGSSEGGFGVYDIASEFTQINHSIIKGTTNSICCVNGGAVYVGSTRLIGPVVTITESTVKCAGVYDELYNFFPSSCP